MSFAGGDVIGEAFVRIRALADKLDGDIEAKVMPAAAAAGAKGGAALGEGLSEGTAKGTKKMSVDLDETGKKFTEFGKKASVAVTLPVVAAFGFATKAASDLNESVNVTGLTFGEARGEVDKFVKSAADIGLSERAAREATASIGGLLANLGFTRKEAADLSIQMATLASDLGSAFNAEPAEAADAISAAVRGETEAIRKYNVSLDEQTVKQKAQQLGLLDANGEMDKHAKAQATLAVIMDQTNIVQGDFRNTADGVANSQRILRAEVENAAAELGTKFLPIVKDVVGGLSGLLDTFTSLPPVAQNVALGVASIAAAAGPVSGAIGGATKVLKLFMSEQDGVSSINPKALAGAAGIAVLTVAVATYTGAIAKAKEKADDFKLAAEGGKVDTSSYEALTKALQDNYAAAKATGDEFTAHVDKYGQEGRATREFVQNLTWLGNEEADLREKTNALADRNAELLRTVKNADEAMNSFAAATGLTREQVERLAASNKIDLTGSYADITNALFKANDKTKEHTTATSDLAAANQVLTDKVASAEDKLKAFKTALDNALGSTISVTEASIRHQDAIDKLREKVTEHGNSLDIVNPKTRETAAAFDAVILSAQGEVEALVKSGQVTEGTTQQKMELVKRLNDLKLKFPELKGPIDDYIAKIVSIPDTAHTLISADTKDAEADLARLTYKIKSLPKSVNFRTNIDPNALINEAYEGRAIGGPVVAGRSYRVGEQGRTEWFTPTVDGVITPDNGGGSISVTVPITIEGNADDATVERLRSVVRQEMTATLESVIEKVGAGVGSRVGG